MAVKLVKDRQSAKGTRSDPFGMRELRGMEEGGQGEGGMAKLVESAAREVLSAAIITGVLALFISSLLVTRLHLLIHGLTPLEHMAVGKFKAELLQQIHHAFPDAHHHQNSLPHQAELWSRARLRPRAVDTGQNLSTQQDETAPKCATPPCKSTKKPISGRVDPATVKENVIHHRATISTKPSGSLRARDCTPHGPKASPVPQKLKNTQASQKTTEKSPNPPPQKKEKSVETPEQHSKLPFPNQKHETKPSRPVPKEKDKPTTKTVEPVLDSPTIEIKPRPKKIPRHSPSSSETAYFPVRWLAAHNEIRERYSVGNLVWSSKLEASAQAWANRCVFEHSHGEAGENIAAGQPTIASVVKDWVYGDNECEAYDPNRPVYSHFTREPNVSCLGRSAGNVLGEFDTNVLAKAGQCLK
ncbi:hypothetical protein PtB15_1B68 [Puccinia triticina]|nr:hypothetical protein PtB15_1B68 [Puccinia triticina]